MFYLSHHLRLWSGWLALFTVLVVSQLFAHSAFAGQCDDGIDNDNDGTIDSLVQIAPSSATSYSARWVDIWWIRNQFGFDEDGAFYDDYTSANQLCRMLGYTRVHDFQGGDRYYSCGDNLIFRFNGSGWVTTGACSHNSYIKALQCALDTAYYPACGDGADNDGDGKIDFPVDAGCATASDTSEVVTDGKCTTSAGSTEFEQCRDALDNDGDGLIDVNDPGCWQTPGVPASYNPSLDNEASATSQCQDSNDNDVDGLIDLLDPGCASPQDNNESDGTSQCQDGIDNDSDGATDFPADFSCSSLQDNDEGNPKSQCQDGVDNDSDNAIDLVDPGCAGPQDNNESDEVLMLSVGVECVLDNFNGTKTALFSYNNATTQTINIAVGSTTSPTTQNEFGPGNTNLDQPTSFTPGITKGAVAVPLAGATVTWSIRPQGGALSTATASAASPACALVQPLADCQGFDNGVLRVLGGYQNLNNFEVKIPIGALNNFSPGNQNQGQPASFLAGLNKGAFNINLTDTSTVLTWTLNGLQAVASTALPICSGECIDTPVGSIIEEINQLALQIANITKQAAAILSSAEATVAKTKQVSSKKKTRTQVRIAARADRVDAERANAKANGYVTQSQELTIQIPDVVKNCPEAPQLCQTVDNGPTIDALRDLFAQARNTAQRTIARAYFRNTGATNRKDSLVAQAKSLEKQGLAQLDQIPRTSTECK